MKKTGEDVSAQPDATSRPGQGRALLSLPPLLQMADGDPGDTESPKRQTQNKVASEHLAPECLHAFNSYTNGKTVCSASSGYLMSNCTTSKDSSPCHHHPPRRPSRKSWLARKCRLKEPALLNCKLSWRDTWRCPKDGGNNRPPDQEKSFGEKDLHYPTKIPSPPCLLKAKPRRWVSGEAPTQAEHPPMPTTPIKSLRLSQAESSWSSELGVTQICQFKEQFSKRKKIHVCLPEARYRMENHSHLAKLSEEQTSYSQQLTSSPQPRDAGDM